MSGFTPSLSGIAAYLATATLPAGSLAASAPMKLTQTWNDGGGGAGVFVGFSVEITSTSSSAASVPFRVQVGGSNILALSRGGNVTLAGSYFSTAGGVGCLSNAGTFSIGASSDVILFRDAAAVLALRNTTNAQTFRWYHTFTDLSNRQNGALKTAAGYVELAAETAGTGADDLDVLLTPTGTGAVRFGTHSALAAETVTGYITIKDAGGTSRKIAVVS